MVKYDTLVVDAAPLLTGTTSALEPLAERFVTTKDVLGEIRDKTSRDLLANSQLGLHVREPSPEAMLLVKQFAQQTGDIAVLSSTDLKICGLAVTIELELNGVNRLRPSLGKPSPAEAKQKARADERRARRQAKKAAREVENTPQSPSATVLEKKDQPPSAENHEEWQQVGSGKAAKVVQDDGDDSDAGEWITPENVKQHKAKALGINPTEVPGEASSEAAQETEAFKTAACLTGDYAMQNVLLQIGITALGPDGMRVKQVRTWVLRCHACFKLCKNPIEKFCPSCGNTTLMRTSITYLSEPTPEHPQGYILHLKKNFQYNNRGSQYSLPTPQSVGGSAKGPKEQVAILRADQKEYLRGKKSYDVKQAKEERRAQRELAAASIGDAPNKSAVEEWIPTLEMSEQARNKHSRNHLVNSIRTDKNGLPLVGMKGNPNASKKKRA